jgi:predicted phage terminase large subunit-like protein
MADFNWTSDYLYIAAKQLADKSNHTLSIDHFWFVADRDLSGPAPRDKNELVARAKNYAVFDLAVEKYGVAGDSDIDASIKRNRIIQENSSVLTHGTVDEILQFFCKTNLLFLGREIFNKAFTFSTHARLANFFVQKNPKLQLFEQEIGELKERLLLYPRGSFKSTLDIIDCVQWILNHPDVRILVLTASDDLATAFIDELKNYFTQAYGAEPTILQSLFPDFVVPKKSDGASGRFICPCRTTNKSSDDEKKEPTAWAASILSNLPGWHCDHMKCDDVVNDKNSETAMLIAKVIKRVDMAESLIDPGGYKDLLGTPYAPSDLYTHTVEAAEKPEDLKQLGKLYPAMWLKPESQHKDEKDCVESDYVLLFESDKTGRKRLTYDFLRKKRRKNLGVFNSQYLLNPAGVKQVKFPLELLLQRTISWEQVPPKLTYYILWDFAYAANADNDYSVGAVVGIDEQHRVYVLEIFREHYKDSDLAMEIAKSNKQYVPRLIPIENSNGAQFLESSIRRYSEEMGVPYIPLDFFKVDRSPNAKASRISALQPLLVQGRLFFVNTIACLDDLYKEFKDFGSSSHDDIPDAISHVHRVLPTAMPEPNGPGSREETQKFLRMLQEKDFYDYIFCQGDYAPPVPQTPVVVETADDSTIDNPWAVPGIR